MSFPYEKEEFTVLEGSKILYRTMRSFGYNRAMADIGVWSALWLEERQLSGISKLVLYLVLSNGKPIRDLKPAYHKEKGLVGVCPFMMAESLLHFSPKWAANGHVRCGVSAEVQLTMAAIVDWAGLQGKSVRLKHWGYEVLYSADGYVLEKGESYLMNVANPEAKGSMEIELCDERAPGTYCKLESLYLPKLRLRNDGVLNLD